MTHEAPTIDHDNNPEYRNRAAWRKAKEAFKGQYSIRTLMRMVEREPGACDHAVVVVGVTHGFHQAHVAAEGTTVEIGARDFRRAIKASCQQLGGDCGGTEDTDGGGAVPASIERR